MNTKVFVTGAAGYLGSAIAARLARAGYEVLGLTRDDAHAEAMSRAGVGPVVGDFGKPETFIGKLKNCDVAVHAAFADLGVPALVDQRALELFADAAEDGRLRRLLYTSGVWVYGDTGEKPVDETSPLRPFDHVSWRAAHEEVVMDLVQHEVVSVVLRPTIVYGESRGIIGGWFAEARERGTVSIYGNGDQHWGLVHRDDVAEAYRLCLEHGQPGDRFLLADGSDFTVREIGESIARATGAALQTIPAAQVLAELGSYGQALISNSRGSSARARRELGWVPRHTSFAAEVDGLYHEWMGPREAQVK